ncbi:MOSC domain-containing protein [Tersicoccus sp. Bi-70]|uniref:MOSC domain-containing protein n=1 Tax=Tersicoccus sp. Bi-70 TaxID=1897634 RepID=UPI0009756F43|nr:MOSC domain-containing protein [Tersicoccus sp. Bi-70]OMH37090.1 hypothetical protein BGP79_15525 [Tersicoccus sp. Bi-70]
MPVTVAQIRRYPVKSMAGEYLDAVELDARGLTGDRWYAVEDGAGHFASGKNTRRFRRHDEVFAYRATTTADGVAVTHEDGSSWLAGDPALDDHLTAAFGELVRVEGESTVPHADDGAVSLIGSATLHWCETELGVDADPRRLRVNLVLETDEPFVEESWVGRTLRVGATTLRVVARIERCRTIDVAQDGADARHRWLKPLGTTRDLCMGVYAEVLEPGGLRVGDDVTVRADTGHAAAPADTDVVVEQPTG